MRFPISTGTRRSRLGIAGGGLIALVAIGAMLILAGSSAASSPTTVPLGTAGSFAVLAGSAITDVPTSSIHGNVGVTPAAGSFVGLGCAEVVGTIYSVDNSGPLPCRVTNQPLLVGAMNDSITAYGNAAGRIPDTTFLGADNQLGGNQTLVAGVYRFGGAATDNLIGPLTLHGSASSVWIFQATSDLKFASNSSIQFSGGAQACNVFWQVGSTATLFTSSKISGTILALTSIVIQHGATLNGRALAQTANVTLDDNSIVRPTCATQGGGSSTSQAPSRAIYCDPNGKAYDLVIGEDKQAPYSSLNLVPAYIDPVTGSASCNFPVAVTTTTTTTTVPPPTPVTPAPTPKPAPAHKTKGVKAAKHVKVVHAAPKPAKHPSGFTG